MLQVRKGHCEYMENDVLRVRIEWVYNHMLFQPVYRTDGVSLSIFFPMFADHIFN